MIEYKHNFYCNNDKYNQVLQIQNQFNWIYVYSLNEQSQFDVQQLSN